MLPEINKYPGLFFIDAHQQGSGYFFPPNEDPVHHEISDFSLDFIQNGIGPALQRAFNDQSAQYHNYNSYDLFTPEYGDTVPSLIMGAAGMTYEKGTNEVYGKQVYDHYLAIDTTLNADVGRQGQPHVATGFASGARPSARARHCALQQNKLVSPLHDTIKQQPKGTVCGYFFKPGQHTADTAALLEAPPEHGREGLHARHAGGRQRLPRVRQLDRRRHAAVGQRPDAARRDVLHPDGAGHEALDPGRPGREPVHPVRLLLRRGHLELPAPARPRPARAS